MSLLNILQQFAYSFVKHFLAVSMNRVENGVNDYLDIQNSRENNKSSFRTAGEQIGTKNSLKTPFL